MKWILVINIFLQIIIVISSSAAEKENCTDLARDDETLLVFSTLGGGLTAVDPHTSEVRWTIEDEPTVKVELHSDVPNPQYLPDPRDGSLYQLGQMGGLKKLPYTIPQLVASAPCRSSDGILYSGKKSDTWFLIDPKTGQREKVLGFGTPSQYKDKIGWATSRSMYLGRTQYTVLMYDSLSNTKPWNVTFFDYSSHTMAPEVSKDYEWLHLTASASGMIVTLDRSRGTFLWQKDLTSPVVATFLLNSDGLLSVPFTTVSDDTLKGIVEYARDGQKSDIKLFQTLYVGEHSSGLYAIPSLVDKNIATISSDPPVKLLDGPQNNGEINQNLVHLNFLLQNSNANSDDKDADNQSDNNKNVLILGHYQMPKVKEDELKLSLTKPSLLKKKSSGEESDEQASNKDLMTTQRDIEILNLNRNSVSDVILPPHNGGIDAISNGPNKINDTNGSINPRQMFVKIYNQSKNYLNTQESQILKVLLIILMGMIVAMFWYLKYTVRELRQSQSGSHTSNIISKGSDSYQELIDLGEGMVKVGKITFNTNVVLGKGCEGTFVFRGNFEKRDVAVKRLLPECFTLADREVSLLRESDAHENVVRYFCTEQDRQFKYIAVELCSATLQDYIEDGANGLLRSRISILDVLKQATNGITHLHLLNIVHRDIKPQNVLISLPNSQNSVRAMISDFGLCKKLNFGKTSFSRRSGITGTEGWIAPEMLKGQRTTTSVDIFSLGCVFYYVLSNGGHPFGDAVKRQLNILSYEYDLKFFTSNNDNNDSSKVLAEELIKSMIRKDPLRRPPATVILNHPFFWNEDRVLTFLQDVSDRVEKLDFLTEPLRTLEKNGKLVVRNDWNLHLDETITADLRKYRGYHGQSVRDLLRALRNKKHHYHELSSDMQKILGSIPIDFTKYWTNRFPHLVSHSYHALENCSTEIPFRQYYNKTYSFQKPDYFYELNDVSDLNELIAASLAKPTRDSPSKKYSKEIRFRKIISIQKQKRDLMEINNGGVTDNNFITRNENNHSLAAGDNKPAVNRRGSYNFNNNDDCLTTNKKNQNWRKTAAANQDNISLHKEK